MPQPKIMVIAWVVNGVHCSKLKNVFEGQDFTTLYELIAEMKTTLIDVDYPDSFTIRCYTPEPEFCIEDHLEKGVDYYSDSDLYSDA